VQTVHFQLSIAADVRRVAGRGNQEVAAFGIATAEDFQGRAVECTRFPFALYGVHLVATARKNEVNLAARFVAPVAHGRFGEMGLQMFQDHMFPEQAKIAVPQRIPTRAKLTNPVSKPYTLGISRFLSGRHVKGPDQRDGVSDFQGTQMALYRGAGDANGRCRLGDFKLSTALAQDVLEKRVEAGSGRGTQQALDVAGKKGIHPLPVESRSFAIGEKRSRQPTVVRGAGVTARQRRRVHPTIPAVGGSCVSDR